MNRIMAALALCLIVSVSCSTPTQKGEVLVSTEEIIGLERAALDRWVKLDPEGYLGLYASDVTYFDPNLEKRADGLERMRALLEPIKQLTVTIADARYEMTDPKVQQHGEIAVLTYNLTNYGKLSGGPETLLARWNSTAVYTRIGREWKIVHSHWSYTKPDLSPQAP